MIDRLNPNESLGVNESISSQNGQIKLIMQEDGNLVLYKSDDQAIWASNTWGQTVSQAIMQDDGNLVIYGPAGAIWASNTWNHPGAWLIAQDDENVVIYDSDGQPLWATNTSAPNPVVSTRFD